MSRVEDLVRHLPARGVMASGSLIGCTDAEIDIICRDQGVTHLPRSYLTFLRLMGRGGGSLLRGTDAFYPELLGLKAAGRELLLEGSADEELGDDSFVIGMHQGYQFFWFPSVLDEEPPVLMYQEGDRHSRRRWANFEDYLEDMVSEIDRR